MIKFEAQRIHQNGKPAIRFVVRGNGKPQDLKDLLESNGFCGVVDISSTMEAICTTPAEIDKARAGLDKWFDRTGSFIG